MKTVKKILLIALLWLIVISSGTLGTLDSSLRLQMSHAWWTGTPEIPAEVIANYKPRERGDIRLGVMGTDGKRYIAYEQGQSVLMVPGDWVGTQLHRLVPIVDDKTIRQLVVSLLIFVPLNAALVLASYWLLRLFDFEPRIAGLTSLVCLLSTTMLHYAQVHQHNNQILLLVALGYAAAVAYVQQNQAKFAVLSGFVLGGAMLIRITSTIHALTVFLFFAGCLIYQHRTKFQKVLEGTVWWVVGFIPLTLVGRIFDFLRYGSFLASGKRVEQQQLGTDPLWAGLPNFPDNYPLINPPHVGILGALFHPAKSIFLYDPLLIPCLVLGIICWRRFSPLLRWYLIIGLLNLGLHLLAYSRFIFWHGDIAWAARYQVTSVHLILFPLVAVLLQQFAFNSGIRAWAVRGLIGIALVVQLMSVAMPMHLEVNQVELGAPGSRLQLRLAQRAMNLVCLANGSISSVCVDRLDQAKQRRLQNYNHLAFFPFEFQDAVLPRYPQAGWLAVLLFVIWGGVLIGAIAMTALYLRYGFH